MSNEGNDGFNAGKHTPADYARLVATTHAAAKAVAPDARIGLTVASFDAPYLNQTIRTLTELGSPNAFELMTETLGLHPKYEGWLALGDDGEGYGFVFAGRNGRPVLVCWAPVGAKEITVNHDAAVAVTRVNGGDATTQPAGGPITLTNTPAFVTGISQNWIDLARANSSRNFP